MLLRKCRPVPLLVGLVWALSWGCSESSTRLGDDDTDANAPPPFTPPKDAASDGEGGLDIPLCVGTECPAPFATCSSSTFKCETDLSRDSANCGACGHACGNYKPIHMASRCESGACQLECFNDGGDDPPTDWRNCNGEVDDGCEVNANTDANNCGGCGNKCPSGEPCLEGRCGCAPPSIFCDGRCVDPNTDDMNCGRCGNACDPAPPGSCAPPPPNTGYGCVGGTCGHMKCGSWAADCNNDIGTLGCNSDGCEVTDLRWDPNNCGGCGIKCKGDEQCIDEGNGPECAVPCARFGRVFCPNSTKCADLLNDFYHCGGCENACVDAGPNQVGSCKKGLCSYECVDGYADCNGDAADGCEVDLRANPANCGVCGKSCDIPAGQPCVDGVCLMVECGPNGGTK